MRNPNLLIYGFGGLGMEVLCYILSGARCHGKGCKRYGFNVVGIIDEEGVRLPELREILGNQVSHFRSIEELDSNNYSFVVAIGNPIARHRCFQSALSAGLKPETIVHPTAIVDPSASIGEGSIFGPFSLVAPCVLTGKNTVVNNYSSLGHDSVLGMSSVLSPYATLNGGARCGANSFLGTRATIIPGKALGDYSKLSAGSVLCDDTADGSLAIGNPAKHRVLFSNPCQE